MTRAIRNAIACRDLIQLVAPGGFASAEIRVVAEAGLQRPPVLDTGFDTHLSRRHRL